MKEKFFAILFPALLFSGLIHAQQTEGFGQKNKKEIAGYTIHLVPLASNTFGFTIQNGKKPIWVQLKNPFIHSREGFKTKSDAYKVAEWVINEDKNGRPPRNMPVAVAKQLNITSAMPNINASPIKK